MSTAFLFTYLFSIAFLIGALLVLVRVKHIRRITEARKNRELSQRALQQQKTPNFDLIADQKARVA